MLPQGPLEGLRVLDLATMLAGPYGATLLGDLGADVIKVESFVGDDSRHLGPGREGERTAFMSLNRNKRAVVIDLTQGDEARAVLEKLVVETLLKGEHYRSNRMLNNGCNATLNPVRTLN